VKALQDGERMREYLALLRTMDGYGSIVFPHCASDAKREGHVLPIVSFQAFRLQVEIFSHCARALDSTQEGYFLPIISFQAFRLQVQIPLTGFLLVNRYRTYVYWYRY
jgi:hypothetical protein